MEKLKNVKFKYVDDASEDVENLDDDVSYTDNPEVVFLQQGQYVLSICGENVILQDEQRDTEQYVITADESHIQLENEEEPEEIVYYASDLIDQIQVFNETEDVSDENETQVEMQQDETMDGDLVQVQEFSDFDEAQLQQQQQPQYQYAILKDGKLHLQTLEVLDSSVGNHFIITENDGLHEQLAAFQQSISLDNTTAPILDLDKITGKNLITGQTVTLDSYFNKLQKRMIDKSAPTNKRNRSEQLLNKSINSSFINKKILVGKTPSGKRIMGKILRIDESPAKSVEIDAAKTDIQEAEDTVQPHVIIKKHIVSREDFEDNIGKTLSGLMGLESVQQKLQNRNLMVKLVEKVYDHNTKKMNKSVSYVYGHMEQVIMDQVSQQQWSFVLHNTPADSNEVTETDENITDLGTNTQLIDDNTLISKEVQHISLTILITVDKDGKKTTRVNMNPKSALIKCQFCNKEFKTVFQMQKHIDAVHSVTEPVCCDICNKQFTNKENLHRHRKIHSGERWHRCSKCSKCFNTAGSLKRHLTIHDPSLRPLECSVCEQRFTDESSLRKHLLIHTGIRAFACDICKRTFINQGDLNFHMRIHDPVKQFSCAVCGREFSRHSNLIRHAEIHEGKGTLHCCHICGCSYSFVSSLTRHIVQKHIRQQQQQQQ